MSATAAAASGTAPASSRQTGARRPDVVRRTMCRLCGGGRLERAVPLAASPIADRYVLPERLDAPQPCYPLDLYFCRDCAHLQLLDVVDPEILFGAFEYTTASSPGLVRHFTDLAGRLMQERRLGPGDLIVDLGSNDGSFLKPFRDAGCRVVGVDPARAIARAATEAGIETLPEFFTSELGRAIRRERGPAAIVSAHNVFAHADDLGDMAEGVRELLADEGVFVFEVSYLADIVQKLMFDTVYHEHLSYHSVGPLCSFFARHGLALEHVERIATKGGSIRGFARKAGANASPSPAVSRLLELESVLGLDRVETFHGCARRLEEIRHEVHRILEGYRARRKVIAGYGASHTVTTLLHQLELGELLDFLVDDNPDKQGRFSPGHHLPVLAPSALAERNAGVVTILAWNYAEPIMSRNAEHRSRGGVFVVPLPFVQIH